MAAGQPSVQLSLANFRKGSFITVEGKRDNDFFFIVKQGQVRITKETDVAGGESGQVLGPGDFFGVVSAMSGHARDESAQAMSDVSLIAVKSDQFGVLIQKNAPIAMKIIRSFSQKLRSFNQQIAKLTLKEESVDDPESLFGIGEYYFKQRNTRLAMYAFVRYLQINPQGLNVANAKERLKTLGPLNPKIGKPVTEFNVTKEDGDFIFCEHEPGNELYILQEGKVKITKITGGNEILLAVVAAGDIFGEMALLDNKPRSASAISYGQTKLLAVNKANFEGMVKSKPQMATRLIQLLSGRIWQAYRQLSNLLIREPVGRLFDTLYTILMKNHVRIEKRQPYQFDFGVKELIHMVGMNPAEGREAINLLMKNKTFSIRDDKLYVDDIEQIDKQAEYYKKMTLLEQKREAGRLKKV